MSEKEVSGVTTYCSFARQLDYGGLIHKGRVERATMCNITSYEQTFYIHFNLAISSFIYIPMHFI